MLDHSDHPGLPGDEIIRRIEEALARAGTHTWEDVREMLLDGRCQIFWNDHGAVVTELMITPLKRQLLVWLVAGELPELIELHERVERYALTMTCDEIIARGRPGWGDLAKRHGWKMTAVEWTRVVKE